MKKNYKNKIYFLNNIDEKIYIAICGDWGFGPIPNPQSPKIIARCVLK